MKMPPIVSPEEWKAALDELLVKEKELTHARDALAAERRRMPRMLVEKEYGFEGPAGPATLAYLGRTCSRPGARSRRQLTQESGMGLPAVTAYAVLQ